MLPPFLTKFNLLWTLRVNKYQTTSFHRGLYIAKVGPTYLTQFEKKLREHAELKSLWAVVLLTGSL